MKQTKTRRIAAKIDTELVLTADLLATAQRLAVYGGWRTACRALYYVLMRIHDGRGRKQLSEFLSEEGLP